ncbi:MAG: hypothetical protein BroJett030_29700 [Alphaproteobacteria bacterium]|nr:MAG: hypothetical protein BroJett030_29700 [Alphaproteobacteria bacterium]
MPRLFAHVLSVMLLACLVAAAPAEAARRLALVIGNDNYVHVTKLKKAVNDAAAVGETLRALGFEVTSVTNTTRRQMNEALSQFVSGVAEGDTAMLFYAGHGVAIDNKNYLLPVDIPDTETADAGFVVAEAFALDDIIARLKARGPRLNLLILDACRNNPFSGAATRSLGADKGLARITAPQGTFVIYSADDGEAALDRLGNSDDNPNSVFTRELVPLMKQPGIDLVDLAREVRRRVNRLAATVRHNQTPSYYDAMLGDFFFAGDAAADPPAEEEQQASLPPAREETQPREPEPRLDAGPAPLAGRALVVTASERDTVCLWDPAEARLISELEGEKISLSAVQLIGGGRALAIAATDGALFAYAIPDFKKQNALYPGFRVTDMAETASGMLILGGQDGHMAAIDAKTFEIVWTSRNHDGIVSPIVIAEDGRSAVSASADGTIVETDLATGAVLHRVATVRGKAITDIAYLSPALVIAVHEDGTIAHINVRSGAIVEAFAGHRGWISSVEVLAGGEYVTAGVDGTLAFWTVGSRNPARTVRAHSDVASGAKLMRFGGADHMISTGFDGILNVWDGQGRQLRAQLRHGRAILFFDYASAG